MALFRLVNHPGLKAGAWSQKMNLIEAMYQAMRVGHQLTHVEAWKNSQAVLSGLIAVGGMFSALGYHLPVSTDTLTGISTTIAGVVGAYLTYATSVKVGIK